MKLAEYIILQDNISKALQKYFIIGETEERLRRDIIQQTVAFELNTIINNTFASTVKNTLIELGATPIKNSGRYYYRNVSWK